MKKFLLAFAAVLALSVPAFAADNFAPLPVNIQSGSHQNINYTSSDEVYACVRGTQVLLWSLTSNVSVSRSGVDAGGNSVSNTAYIRQAVSDYYVGAPGDSVNLSDFVSTPAIEPFPSNTTDAQVADALTLYLSSSGSTVVSTFTVPSGNVLYFLVSSEQDVDFDANMPRLSSLLFASQYGPWGNTGIKFGPAASLPTSGTMFPILSQDNVRWFVQLPTNVFGQSKIGTMQKHCLVGQWYALYCPDVFGLNETSADLDSNSTVPGASVKVSGSFSQIKVYPLTSTFDFSEGEFITSSIDDFSSYFDGTIDENGSVTFTDQDGNVNSPASGGQNFQDYETDPFALVENIKTILNNILSEIKSLFTFGYDAIQSLVNIMSDFVNVFQQLYAWLPSEVYTALVSAIIVAITIGVFKVFL